ncbi:hypothetical protein A0R60_4023 [Enterobacter asburiae]|nr:hypothetical protein A0R60_4023 [Enterobacter asburiae]
MIIININDSFLAKRGLKPGFTHSLHSNFLMMFFTLICVHLCRIARNVAPLN